MLFRAIVRYLVLESAQGSWIGLWLVFNIKTLTRNPREYRKLLLAVDTNEWRSGYLLRFDVYIISNHCCQKAAMCDMARAIPGLVIRTRLFRLSIQNVEENSR